MTRGAGRKGEKGGGYQGDYRSGQEREGRRKGLSTMKELRQHFHEVILQVFEAFSLIVGCSNNSLQGKFVYVYSHLH